MKRNTKTTKTLVERLALAEVAVPRPILDVLLYNALENATGDVAGAADAILAWIEGRRDRIVIVGDGRSAAPFDVMDDDESEHAAA